MKDSPGGRTGRFAAGITAILAPPIVALLNLAVEIFSSISMENVIVGVALGVVAIAVTLLLQINAARLLAVLIFIGAVAIALAAMTGTGSTSSKTTQKKSRGEP